MYATISADIVSSTSLSRQDTINLKQQLEVLFSLLESKYPSFWGRQVKGDYIECLVSDVNQIFRIALILKTYIKSLDIIGGMGTRNFRTYGIRMAIGIGKMRIIDRQNGIMDGEAIYLSGRAIENAGVLSKGTFTIKIENEQLAKSLHVVAVLTDALINNATRRQCEVLYYKLLSMKETDIAEVLGIKQSSVNEHSSSAKWYCIEEALDYFEQIKFENYE